MAIGRPTLALVMLAIAGMPRPARAQDGLFVQPAIPQGFDRDRNVNVQSRPRPSYAPIGMRVGGLMIFPQLRTAAGATDNAYLTQRHKTAARFVTVEPAVRLVSIWSRHSLQLSASSLRRSYIGESRRDEHAWNIETRGDVELGRALTITGVASARQDFENQFSGEVTPGVAALSRFRRGFASLRSEYVNGRMRAFLLVDRSEFRFAPLRLAGGAVRSQSTRNRDVSRITAQFEYARTPSVSLFGQLGYADTAFAHRTGAMLGSRAVRVVGGLNADLAGRMRGTITIGYGVREYRTSGFGTIGGPIVEGRGELFPTERLTITTGLRRTIEDSTFGGGKPQPFWDNRLSLGGDYEALRNLILSANGEYVLQTYVGSRRRNATYRLATQARLLISRRATLTAGMSYSDRQSQLVRSDDHAAEGRIEAGLTYHL